MTARDVVLREPWRPKVLPFVVVRAGGQRSPADPSPRTTRFRMTHGIFSEQSPDISAPVPNPEATQADLSNFKARSFLQARRCHNDAVLFLKSDAWKNLCHGRIPRSRLQAAVG